MATQKRNALGRGLDALLSMDDVKTEGSSSINEIELAKITVNPNQPRREFDETALQELAGEKIRKCLRLLMGQVGQMFFVENIIRNL